MPPGRTAGRRLLPILLAWLGHCGSLALRVAPEEAPAAEVRAWKPAGVASARSGNWYFMEDVCLDGRSSESLAESEYEVDAGLQMAVLPGAVGAARGYRRVNGTMLVIMIHHGFPWDTGNVQHVITSVFPTAEALDELRAAGPAFESLANVSAVAAWQLQLSVARAFDLTAMSMKLLGSRGRDTRVFVREDVEKGVCADRVIRLGMRRGSQDSLRWFRGPEERLAFRAKALHELNLEDASPPDCQALLVTREPPQGIANSAVLEQAMSRALPRMGWGIKFFRSSSWKMEHSGREVSFEDQVGLFHDVSLSIMVHGAEAMNMVWQPPGAAHVIVVKCDDNGAISRAYARRMNFTFWRSYPANCTRGMPGTFSYDVNERALYYADFERDLLPTVQAATRDLEDRGVCRPRRSS